MLAKGFRLHGLNVKSQCAEQLALVPQAVSTLAWRRSMLVGSKKYDLLVLVKSVVLRLIRLGIFLFGPDMFLRQLVGVIAVISLRHSFWYMRKASRAVRSSLLSMISMKELENRELRNRRAKSKDYENFRRLGEELDKAEGLHEWKRDDQSSLFDASMLKSRTKQYLELMEKRDVEGCLYLIRHELLRKHFGVCNPKLFQVTHTGTKHVVEKYVDTVCQAMTWAALEHHEHSNPSQTQVKVTEKIAFFTETKHSFGRCALLLSGGAQLGMYHFGVIKALHKNGLLPKIISGTSAGSIVLGMIAGRTDDELNAMWDENFSWTKHFKTDFFGGFDFKRFVRCRGESLYSTDALSQVLKHNIGDWTFLEAFDRTGRICNVTVSGVSGNTNFPMLLNYLTAPNVLIWSASVASCAVPGIFEPRELLAKDRYGKIVPYFPGGLRWRDGSIQNDLPMTRLTEMFNVNFFIVSQVNPQAMLFSGGGFASSRGPIYRTAQFLRREVKQYLLSLSEFGLGTAGQRVSPWLRPVGISAIGLLVQEYEGDITIFNGKGMREIPGLLTNGSEKTLREYTRTSERTAWRHIPQIENSCKIEFVMEEILRQLRAESLERRRAQKITLASARRNSFSCDGHLLKEMISKDLGLKRLPSFQQEMFSRSAGEESPKNEKEDNAKTSSQPSDQSVQKQFLEPFKGAPFVSHQSMLNLLAVAEDD